MKFSETPLRDAYLIELDKQEDQRGFFARLFCEKEFTEMGLEKSFVQVNNSLSLRKGTLRGLHYQLEPAAETKVVRCTAGIAWDVILDLRPGSPFFGQSFGVELSEANRTMIYVPKGFAHGIITLTDNTELLYLVSAFYSPQLERGIRWNDPLFRIKWPIDPVVMSNKDSGYPDFKPEYHLKT